MKEKGFILIELLIVFAIISITMGVIISTFGFSNYEIKYLKENANILASDLLLARVSAIKESIYYRIEFFPGLYEKAWEYRVKRESESEPIKTISKFTNNIHIISTNFPSNEVYFYPNGAPSSGGTIVLKNSKGKRLYIKIEAAVGRIRVTDINN